MKLLSLRFSSFVLLTLSWCAAPSPCGGQTEEVLCREGSSNFGASFHGDVTVHVGAAKSGGLATRTCEATLSWGEQSVTVASGTWEVDLDVFGADLGMGLPVAAFQVRKSDSDCCTTYSIYSLQKPARLLRTLTGGSSFRASDLDLDTRVEIWTDDAASVDGLDRLSASELDFPPPVALRFEHNELLDVGAEFQPYFDQLIARVRGQIDPRDLKDFKGSDGQLAPSVAFPPEFMHRLRRVKIGILEIVWSYLNSGRERDAWNTLAEMWPNADVERVRAAIVKARDRGIHTQVDGVAPAMPAHKKKRATIFDVTMTEEGKSEVVRPKPILLRRPPPSAPEQGLPGDVSLELVVDAAGKVRSIAPSGNTKSIDADLISAAMGWKFIPALNGGHAVASRTRLVVSIRK